MFKAARILGSEREPQLVACVHCRLPSLCSSNCAPCPSDHQNVPCAIVEPLSCNSTIVLFLYSSEKKDMAVLLVSATPCVLTRSTVHSSPVRRQDPAGQVPCQVRPSALCHGRCHVTDAGEDGVPAAGTCCGQAACPPPGRNAEKGRGKAEGWS